MFVCVTMNATLTLSVAASSFPHCSNFLNSAKIPYCSKEHTHTKMQPPFSGFFIWKFLTDVLKPLAKQVHSFLLYINPVLQLQKIKFFCKLLGPLSYENKSVLISEYLGKIL